MAAAASAIEPEHNTTAGGTDRAHSSKQHRRRRLLSHHLHIQVPVPASSGWSSGRPSGPASAPSGGCNPHDHAHLHQDHRPASPSLLRSPTAWIRSKSHGFGSSSSSKHTPRRSGNNFHYDARSYAQNFDEGGGREEDRYLSLRLLASPHQVSPSPSSSSNLQGTSGGGGGSSNGEEPARETLRVME